MNCVVHISELISKNPKILSDLSIFRLFKFFELPNQPKSTESLRITEHEHNCVAIVIFSVKPGADWLHFGRVAIHGPAPCKRGHRRNLSKRPIWTGPRRAGGRGVKAAPIGKHTGPHHDLAGRPRLHWHLSNNASPPLCEAINTLIPTQPVSLENAPC